MAYGLFTSTATDYNHLHIRQTMLDLIQGPERLFWQRRGGDVKS